MSGNRETIGMRKCVFLDRDGTINKEVEYLHEIEKIEILDFVVEGLRLLQQDYLLIIVSNQSGVARGFFGEQEVKKVNQEIINRLKLQNVDIQEAFYCPHHPDGVVEEYAIDCNCRKPKSGLIEKAQKKYDLDLNNSYVVGDKLSDMQLAQSVGCKGILVTTGYGSTEIDAVQGIARHISSSILEAAQWILQGTTKEKEHGEWNI